MDGIARLIMPHLRLPADARLVAACAHPADRRGGCEGMTGFVVRFASGIEAWTLTGDSYRSISPTQWRKRPHELVGD